MTALKPSEVLAKAADLIEPEGAWTQGAWARDSHGAMATTDKDAVCWCLWGSLTAITSNEAPAFGFLSRTLPIEPQKWNDATDRTQAEVVKALRDAAELARSQGL